MARIQNAGEHTTQSNPISRQNIRECVSGAGTTQGGYIGVLYVREWHGLRQQIMRR
jgi:hypothetical protein